MNAYNDATPPHPPPYLDEYGSTSITLVPPGTRLCPYILAANKNLLIRKYHQWGGIATSVNPARNLREVVVSTAITLT